jgi:tetratricopeptide (TPR) repeat protein
MKKIVLIVLVSLLVHSINCTSTKNLSTHTKEVIPSTNLAEQLTLSGKEFNLARTALITSKEVYPDLDINNYINKIDNMSSELKQTLGDEDDAVKIINMISYYLFKQKGYSVTAIPADLEMPYDKQFCYFLNEVLDKHTDLFSPVMALLCLCLCERLNLPVYYVSMPSYSFPLLRYDNGNTRVNIEIGINNLIIGKSDNEYKALLNITPQAIEKNKYLHNADKEELFSLVLLMRAEYFTRLKEYDKSLKDTEYVLKLASLSMEVAARVINSFIYKNRKNYVKAFAEVNKIIELEPGNPGGYLTKALLYRDYGQIDYAISELNAGIENTLPIFSSSLYTTRGSLYYAEKHDADKAIEDYSKAIGLDSSYLSAYFGRGLVCIDVKRFDEAILDMTYIVEHTQDRTMSYNAYGNRAKALGLKGDAQKAISDSQKAIDIDPSRPEAYYLLSLDYYDLDDYDKAYQYVLETIKHCGTPFPKLVEELEKKGYSIFPSKPPENNEDRPK